jgi:hypothetical protein
LDGVTLVPVNVAQDVSQILDDDSDHDTNSSIGRVRRESQSGGNNHELLRSSLCVRGRPAANDGVRNVRRRVTRDTTGRNTQATKLLIAGGELDGVTLVPVNVAQDVSQIPDDMERKPDQLSSDSEDSEPSPVLNLMHRIHDDSDNDTNSSIPDDDNDHDTNSSIGHVRRESQSGGNSQELLRSLLCVRGRPAAKEDGRNVRRRVIRGRTGHAAKIAKVLVSILSEVNISHKLSVSPVSLRDVLAKMDEGQVILKECQTSNDQRVLAQGAIDIVGTSGRACKSAVVAALAVENKAGKVSPTRLSELTNVPTAYIKNSKTNAVKGNNGMVDKANLGTFANQNKTPHFTKSSVPDLEYSSSRHWFMSVNPARSGDPQAIAWMSKSKDNFYFENYRTVEGQVEIILMAFKEGGEEIIMKQLSLLSTNGRKPNLWQQNCLTYINARNDNALCELGVHELSAERPLTTETLAGLVVAAVDAENLVGDEEDDGDESETIMDDVLSTDPDLSKRLLYPRSQRCLYKGILKGIRMWKRPDHDHCSRCGDHVKLCACLMTLQAALLSTALDPEYQSATDVVQRAGGTARAWERVREITNKIPDLAKHVKWRQTQRKYLKGREKMTAEEAVLQLDYGGVQDSHGKKVSVWSATVITIDREQEHFDFFFDALDSKKADHNGAKKNGSTGIFFLYELFDPKRGPKAKPGETQKSLFTTRFPTKNSLIFSGDTGNGYRAYMMLEFFSTMKDLFGIMVELIPLSPGHAWNLTDARIAHMNTFLRIIKRSSRIFGAVQVAAAFHLASDPAIASKRKFMARSNVFFREVKSEWTPEQTEEFEKQKGAVLLDKRLHQGKMGVKGLLYFKFSFNHPDGSVHYPQGYASVREHGDPRAQGNPTYVYTWRKDLNRLMCQPCSNHAVCISSCCIFYQYLYMSTKCNNANVFPTFSLRSARLCWLKIRARKNYVLRWRRGGRSLLDWCLLCPHCLSFQIMPLVLWMLIIMGFLMMAVWTMFTLRAGTKPKRVLMRRTLRRMGGRVASGSSSSLKTEREQVSTTTP